MFERWLRNAGMHGWHRLTVSPRPDFDIQGFKTCAPYLTGWMWNLHSIPQAAGLTLATSASIESLNVELQQFSSDYCIPRNFNG